MMIRNGYFIALGATALLTAAAAFNAKAQIEEIADAIFNPESSKPASQLCAMQAASEVLPGLCGE